jgi:hypothetical protein
MGKDSKHSHPAPPPKRDGTNNIVVLIPSVLAQVMNGIKAANSSGLKCRQPREVVFSVQAGRNCSVAFGVRLGDGCD